MGQGKHRRIDFGIHQVITEFLFKNKKYIKLLVPPKEFNA